MRERVFVSLFIFAADEFEKDEEEDARSKNAGTRKKRADEVFFFEFTREIR
jgi:hypothetical protein